ncbi:MAG: hypothetical protein SGBAC_007186 [Bacillariaceae sp.]
MARKTGQHSTNSHSNALGYFRNSRTEDGIDPNRDFPYDLQDSTLCMRTIAGRTLNEVFREHLFQMALTFHAGMEVVAYEWGAPNWYGYLSPDDLAQHDIAAAYSDYGGTWNGGRPYQYGTMNDMVYYVRGGMEDWAYAGSWDSNRVPPCQPNTYNGYPLSKTRYNNSTLRAFNMLVETSDSKNPIFNLGRSEDVLNPKANGSGHIARNIRLSLLSADLVEPYVSILQVNNLSLPHDVIPLSPSSEDCGTTMAVNANETLDNKLEISFTVGGALSIDQVQLWFASKTDNLVSTASNSSECWKQPTFFELQSFSQGTIAGSNSGSGRFSANGPIPAASTTSGIMTNGPLFVGTIDIPKGIDELIVMASARVDSDWKNGPAEGAGPNVQPQSHMANARTNPNWRHESAGKIVQGRLDWYSQPLTVVVNNSENDNDSDNDSNNGTVGPSTVPTSAPSFIASSGQTLSSSEVPSVSPSVSKTQTLNPTTAATNRPSDIQSTPEPTITNGQLWFGPTKSSTKPSTKQPTKPPTEQPTDSPTISPSLSSQVPTPPDEDRSSDPTGSGILSEIPITPTSPPADDDDSSSTMIFTSFISIFISLVAAFAAYQ